jgi:hypothetical protein
MGEIRVRCVGTPVEVGGREEPTEIDLIQPCGWEGTAQAPVGERLDDHCPMCDGVVERADPKVEQATDEMPIAMEPVTQADRDLVQRATSTDLTGVEVLPEFEVEQTTTTPPENCDLEGRLEAQERALNREQDHALQVPGVEQGGGT